MLSSLSKLTPEQLEEVRSLEKEIGKTLLSYSTYDVIAESLTDEQIRKVRELEEKIGTVLVAVRDAS